MKKTDLIANVAATTGMTKRASAEAVKAVFESMTGALNAGEKVTVTGFGTLEVKARAARAGRNPKTGEAITIPAHNAVVFKAGKGLRDIVNE